MAIGWMTERGRAVRPTKAGGFVRTGKALLASGAMARVQWHVPVDVPLLGRPFPVLYEDSDTPACVDIY